MKRSISFFFILLVFFLAAESLWAGPVLHWTWEKTDEAVRQFRLSLDNGDTFELDGSCLSYDSPFDGNSHTLAIAQSYDGENWSDPTCFSFCMSSFDEPTAIRWTWGKTDEAVAFFRCILDEGEPILLDGSTTSFEIPYDGERHSLSISASYDGVHWGKDVTYAMGLEEGLASSSSAFTLSSSQYSYATTDASVSNLHDWIGIRVLSDWQFGDYESSGGWIPNSMLAYPGFGLGLGWKHDLSSSLSLGLETSFLYRGTKKGSPYTMILEEGTVDWNYCGMDDVALSLGTTFGATYSSCLGLGSFGYTVGLDHALTFAVSDEASVSLKTKLYAVQEIFENGRLSTVFVIQPLVLAMDVRL